MCKLNNTDSLLHYALRNLTAVTSGKSTPTNRHSLKLH